MKALTPEGVHKPFANYAHGVEIPVSWRIVRTSGQLGIRVDGTIPNDPYEQATVCFQNISKILHLAKMDAADVAHITAFVTHRDHMTGYMLARDEFMANVSRLPASTVVIVSGFTRAEFLVEVEVMAAAP